MKYINILTAGLLLCAGLASCEMKDELKGGSEGSTDTGFLDLSVSVNTSQNNMIARADVEDDNVHVGTSVSAANFPVEIVGTTDETYVKNYASYAELQAAGLVRLPVGVYVVTAHSNTELAAIMSEPYYEGSAECTIAKDIQSNIYIVCTMKNTKIQIAYTANFLANFTEWDITVDDGTTNTLTFDEADENPAAVYWMVSENRTELKVGITATNLRGEKVSETRTLTKPASATPSYWTGGDALTITMNESTPEDPTGIVGNGIDINVDLTFEEEGETVTIPVTPGTSTGGNTGTGSGDTGGSTEEPDTPSTSNLSMVFPGTNGNITYTLEGNDMPAIANVEISAPDGIESLIVSIEAGNTGFAAALSEMSKTLDLLNGVDIVGNTTMTTLFQSLYMNIDVPEKGNTSYIFPIHSFFTLMNVYKETAPDSHVFKMTLTDQSNNTVSGELSVTINPAQ